MEGHGSGGPGLEPRVKELETGFHALHADMSRMGKEQERQGRELARVSSSVEGFGRILADVSEKLDIQRTKRPELSAMAGVVAVILAIGGAVLWPINDKIDRTLNQIESQQEIINARGVIIGEFYADRRHLEQDVERLQNQIERLHQ